MTRRASICSLSVLVLWLVWSAGCTGPPRGGEETQPGGKAAPDELSRYDPLESDQARQVVPRAFPSDQPVYAGDTQQAMPSDTTDDAAGYLGPDEVTDSLNHQSFRVQILTTKVYGEASAARRVAEEVFDRPVFMDYEVPYFKLRVGNFADRDAAESYQQRAKAAGYANAWVVVVTVGVEESAPLYDSLPAEAGDSLDYEIDPGQDD
jgi:hypothetical protein